VILTVGLPCIADWARAIVAKGCIKVPGLPSLPVVETKKPAGRTPASPPESPLASSAVSLPPPASDGESSWASFRFAGLPSPALPSNVPLRSSVPESTAAASDPCPHAAVAYTASAPTAARERERRALVIRVHIPRGELRPPLCVNDAPKGQRSLRRPHLVGRPRVRRSAPDVRPDPVVVLPGGPGQAATESVRGSRPV
jgi:hypothetical protein